MQELIEQPIQQEEEQIRVIFTFVNNWTFTQHVFVKDAGMVEDLLAWFRDKKSKPMWTWDYTKVSKIMLIQKSHIVAIDIENYIELTRTTYKWYEKIVDKLLTVLIFIKLKFK